MSLRTKRTGQIISLGLERAPISQQPIAYLSRGAGLRGANIFPALRAVVVTIRGSRRKARIAGSKP